MLQTFSTRRSIIGLATKGTGTNEEQRLKRLLSSFDATYLPFDKGAKVRSFKKLLRELRSSPPSLLVMEGTGIAGGLLCLISRFLFGHRYVVSSGDAIGPFVASHSKVAGPLFAIYERLLCRYATGFIGWTPYLVGRALTFGCKRGMTAPGWVIGGGEAPSTDSRNRVRQRWGVAPEDIVFGLLGSLEWNARKRYCYGLELVKAIKLVERPEIKVVIVGDGSGLAVLREIAGDDLGRRVFLPGRVTLQEVMGELAGFDVASLPQSLDGVGAFRYTTKISEYQSAGLPIVTSQIPAAYDLPLVNIWRLPGEAPWEEQYINELASLMKGIKLKTMKMAPVSNGAIQFVFDEHVQVARVTSFLIDILNELDRK